MKISPFSIFLITVIVGSLVLLGNGNFGYAQSGTNVNGIYYSNVNWTQANSPYTLTGPVGISAGVTLTIQPGVTVNIGIYSLQINGTLNAQGSNADKISFVGQTTTSPTFSNGQIIFSTLSTNWNEQYSSGCIIENSVLNTLSITIENSSPKINANSFVGTPFQSAIGCGGGSPIISNNSIIGAGAPFAYSGITCSGNNNASISDNLISGWWVSDIWAYSGSPVIENNVITNSGGSVTAANPGGAIRILSNATPIIRNNTITNNAAAGITITDSPSPVILNNNIFGNPYSIYIYSGTPQTNINATYNWWGTTDSTSISQSIYDSADNFNLGTVSFVPFLASINLAAPSQSYNPNPTPTPSPSPSPTPSPTPSTAPPTQTPTQTSNPTATPTPNPTSQTTQSQNASPSPTPSVPEFPIWIVLALVIGITLLFACLKKNRLNSPTLQADLKLCKTRLHE